MSDSKKIVNVLWLSRHDMSAQQKEDLASHPQLRVGLPAGTEVVIAVISVNMVYPANGLAAAEAILESGEEHNAVIIAGVFPAHVAVALSRRNRWKDTYMYRVLKGVMVPVSVPSPATEGETRGGGFIHSHWEAF